MFDEADMRDRRDNWVSLSQVAAWIMSAIGGVVIILSSGFAIYIATNIEDIKTNIAVMTKDNQYTQIQITKLETRFDLLADRVTKMEFIRRPLIGDTTHE